MDVPAIAKIAFTSEDRVAREVIHNFNRHGFDSLPPKYSGRRPPKFTVAEHQAIREILDNFSPHLSTKTDARVGERARANNVELASTPHEPAGSTESRGPVHRAAPLLSRRHGPRELRAPGLLDPALLAWRIRQAQDRMRREVVKRAKVA
jgi:hypothetical protein